MTSALKHFKISICVVCMNRLHHLRQTLIQNINDNADYEQLEFVLLDYNSTDGMEEWVRENLTTYIESGRLVYYKTTIPNSWNPSHSKNLAFKLATGDIICNIWADYYTGSKFARYVNDSFLEDDNIVLTPIDFHRTKKGYSPPGDVLGKVCVKKGDFLKIRGFDERINKHGFEDYDFINRLEMVGVKRVLIENCDFLKFVAHDNVERYNLRDTELEGVYINYVSYNRSQVLILFQDNTFYKATIIDNTTIDSQDPSYAYTPRNVRFDFTLTDTAWITGCWREENSVLFFSGNNETCYLSRENDNEHPSLVSQQNQTIFYVLHSKEHVKSILEFKHFYDTRIIMEGNLHKQTPIVNSIHFGEASIIRNSRLGSEASDVN